MINLKKVDQLKNSEFKMKYYIKKYQKPNGSLHFAAYTDFPSKKGRTPEWDADEQSIFNDYEDQKYFTSNNIQATKQKNTPYYIDNQGFYHDGVIYNNKDGKNWNHYKIGLVKTRGGESWNYLSDNNGVIDTSNLTLDQYNNIVHNLKLDFQKFIRPKEGYTYEDYIPNDKYKINYTTDYNNAFITYKPYDPVYHDLQPNKVNYDKYQKEKSDGWGTYIVKDDNYNFTLEPSSPTRSDAGYEFLFNVKGNYPKELEQYQGKLYKSQNQSEEVNKTRISLNNILSKYGITLKQGGSIHIKEKNKGKFTKAAKRAGKSVQEHARDVVNNPKATKLQKKRAQFALNAKKFKHG